MFGFHGNSYGHGDSKRELTNPMERAPVRPPLPNPATTASLVMHRIPMKYPGYSVKIHPV